MRWGRPIALCALWLGQLMVFLLLRAQMQPAWAFALACCVALPFALRRAQPLSRRIVLAGGFGVTLAAFHTVGSAPAWIWLVPLCLAAGVYPVLARSDAPLWPSPAEAARRLPVVVPLADASIVIDAGSGLGHAARALARAYPACHVIGIEASALLVALSRIWPGRGAETFRRGDLWSSDWSSAGLVYLFLRPEAMRLALDKALGEMSDRAAIVSLEFKLPATESAQERLHGGQMIYVYRVSDLRAQMQAHASPAAKTACPAAHLGPRHS
jgi:SAM-dependent methyltransferase